jgi:tRNA(Ile)-lysidine synthetase-like protein
MLPDGWVVSIATGGLQFHSPSPAAAANSDYEYSLSVPGAVEVPEAGTRFEAALVSGGAGSGYNPDHMLDPALLQKELTVRNWRAGDRYWPAHSKAPKKIKELLQERKLTGPAQALAGWGERTGDRVAAWLSHAGSIASAGRHPAGPGNSRVGQSGRTQA